MLTAWFLSAGAGAVGFVGMSGKVKLQFRPG